MTNNANMTIGESRRCNIWSIRLLAAYLDAPEESLLGYYHELQEDQEFLNALNQQIRLARESGFIKGIFANESLDSIDWFGGQRIILYVLLRYLKPQRCLETGVFYGGNTAFILNALKRNQSGRLVSIDLPAERVPESDRSARHPGVGTSEYFPQNLNTGFIVPPSLHGIWELILKSSLEVIPRLQAPFGFFLHDSEHSFEFMLSELRAALPLLTNNAVLMADDIDWSNGFFQFCTENRFIPLCLTDNGKDHLRMRTGLTWRGSPKNGIKSFTG